MVSTAALCGGCSGSDALCEAWESGDPLVRANALLEFAHAARGERVRQTFFERECLAAGVGEFDDRVANVCGSFFDLSGERELRTAVGPHEEACFELLRLRPGFHDAPVPEEVAAGDCRDVTSTAGEFLEHHRERATQDEQEEERFECIERSRDLFERDLRNACAAGYENVPNPARLADLSWWMRCAGLASPDDPMWSQVFEARGLAVAIWANGRGYRGGWRNGRPEGAGRMWWPDGSVWEGTFEAGELTNGRWRVPPPDH